MLLDRRRNEIVERGYADSLKNYREKKKGNATQKLEDNAKREFFPRKSFFFFLQ